MMSLFDNAARVGVIKACKEHFHTMPNGQPKTLTDFIVLSALSSCRLSEEDPDPDIVGAQVRFFSLLGVNPTFTDERRAALLKVAAAHLAGDPNPAMVHPSIPMVLELDTRCRGLWNKVQADRSELERRSLLLLPELDKVLPSGLELKSHQLECLVMLRDRHWRAIIADDMGLGKTIEALASIALRGEEAFPVVVASPLSMVYRWQKESEKWLARFDPVLVELKTSTTPQIIERAAATGRAMFFGSWQQILIWHGLLMRLRPPTAIGDEFHYLSNWKSQRTEGFRRMSMHSQSVLGLTGTMMPNGRHRESYAQLKMVNQRVFRFLQPNSKRGDWREFGRHFCGGTPIFLGTKKNGKKRVRHSYEGRSNEVEFGRLCHKHVIRRTKPEVFGADELPSKTRYKIPIPMTSRDQLKIAGLRDQVRSKIQGRASKLEAELRDKGVNDEAIARKLSGILGSEAVMMLGEMRQLVGKMKAKWSVTRLRELIKEGHRVIVFCYHNAVAHQCVELYRKAFGDDEVLLGLGSFSGKRRGELIERAESGHGSIIVLTSAYREGITLISYDWMLMIERWWIPGEEMQGEDRFHRIGQEKDVAVEYPHCEGTSDDAMAELAVWKEAGQQQAAGAAELRSYEQRAYDWVMSEVSA